MAWDSTCADCRWIDIVGEKDGKYPCLNPKSEYKMVSARMRKCSCYGETFYSSRSQTERDSLERNSKSHGYFIITAFSKILGLEENNKFISAFAYIKDEVMPNVEEYQGFLEEYEATGPTLSEKLLAEEDAFDYAEMLRIAYLEEFVELVCMERADDAISLYKDMYDMLLQDFGVKRAYQKPMAKKLG